MTEFAYDQYGNAWADLNSSDGVVTRRVYLNATDALFARISSTGSEDWYLMDHLGSVRGLMNNSGGLDDAISYDAWGNITSESSPSNGDRYKYTGREWDTELNLQYNRARYYDPSTGRWLSQDSLGFAAGDSNLFRYVDNTPTNANDPTGSEMVPESASSATLLNLTGTDLFASVWVDKSGKAIVWVVNNWGMERAGAQRVKFDFPAKVTQGGGAIKNKQQSLQDWWLVAAWSFSLEQTLPPPPPAVGRAAVQNAASLDRHTGSALIRIKFPGAGGADYQVRVVWQVLVYGRGIPKTTILSAETAIKLTKEKDGTPL